MSLGLVALSVIHPSFWITNRNVNEDNLYIVPPLVVKSQKMWATLFIKNSKSGCLWKQLQSEDSVSCFWSLSTISGCSRLLVQQSTAAVISSGFLHFAASCLGNKEQHWIQPKQPLAVPLYLHLWHAFTQHFALQTLELYGGNRFSCQLLLRDFVVVSKWRL